jgi:hypothetical protein
VRRHDAPRWAHLRRCLLEEGVRAIERGIWSISTTHAASDIGEALSQYPTCNRELQLNRKIGKAGKNLPALRDLPVQSLGELRGWYRFHETPHPYGRPFPRDAHLPR